MKGFHRIADRVFEEHIGAARYSPDGQLLAIGRQSDSLGFYDARHLASLHEGRVETGGILALEFSPDGQVLALAGESGVLSLVKVATAEIVDQLNLVSDERNLSRWIEFIVWSRDSTMIAASCGRDVVFIDRESRAIVSRRDCGASVSSMSLLPDGDEILVSRSGGVWFLSFSGQEGDSFMPFPGVVLNATCSPSSRYINAGLLESSVAIWDRKDDEPLIMRGYERKVSEMAWTPLSGPYQKQLFAAGGGRDISLWDFTDGPPDGQRPQFLIGHRSKVNDLRFLKSVPWLMSASQDGALRVWQGSRQWKSGFTLQLDRPLLDIQLAPSEDRLFITGDKGHGWLYRIEA